MKKFAVIVAGGSGSRMGGAVPKQFMILCGRPVLWHTLEIFLKAFEDLKIILVVPAAYRPMATRLVDESSGADRIALVDGGDTRFHSVRRGLERVSSELGAEDGKETVIFVHDGVRCLVRVELVRRCYEQALQLGSAIPVADCRDSVRLAEDEGKSKPIDRSRIK
ncbi:MAG TPA: 2-C-methyl-D-erythritol 4-phosphate cytidylyltransferase, partial [Puia sp.]|nr:2-C-methyl-D-erythritol 4-phosphate cytidylyltransferase [Puia sp.]